MDVCLRAKDGVQTQLVAELPCPSSRRTSWVAEISIFSRRQVGSGSTKSLVST